MSSIRHFGDENRKPDVVSGPVPEKKIFIMQQSEHSTNSVDVRVYNKNELIWGEKTTPPPLD